MFVAQFIVSQKMNQMPCTTSDGQFVLEDGNGGALGSDARSGAVQLGIRPEYIAIGAFGAGDCDGVVQVSEYLGADFFHYVDCGPLGLLTILRSDECQAAPRPAIRPNTAPEVGPAPPG